MNERPSKFLCCDLSADANEPLFGTAVTVNVWFMLEYTCPWQAKATSDNELSDDIQAWLDRQVEKTNGRLQFIRQFRPDVETKTFMVGVNSRLYEFQLSEYEDLLDLDITAVLTDDAKVKANLVTQKRYFICTNGKRDRSCAIRGAALYREFSNHVGSQVWMTTHLGGHRFAPTLLSLPDGFCYGRIHPEDVAQLVSSSNDNEIWLDKLRGQTRYSKIEQVADYFLRTAMNMKKVDGFVIVDAAEENGRWQIKFQNIKKQKFIVSLTLSDPIEIFPNSNNPKTKEIAQYKLLKITNEQTDK